jgi:phosphoglycolate phosphatase
MIMSNISAVIFDCDGVMFDSRQANINFYNHILSHFGLSPMNAEDEYFAHMHTAMETIRHLFKGSPLLEKAQEYRLRLDYTPFIKDMIIEPGLKELLRYLKPRYGLAVATNRSNTINRVLEKYDLACYFDIVVSSLDVEMPKPHPEPIFRILNFFKIGPDECIYIGDSNVDLQACTAAGVKMAAYRNKDLKADAHIERLVDINDILRS